MDLSVARKELERKIAASNNPYEEQSVVLGYVDGAEVCLMGWAERPSHRDVKDVPTHANSADSMQIVLEGGMEIYYPDKQTTVVMRPGDCHVVPASKPHSCVSAMKSLVLVVVGHRARET